MNSEKTKQEFTTEGWYEQKGTLRINPSDYKPENKTMPATFYPQNTPDYPIQITLNVETHVGIDLANEPDQTVAIEILANPKFRYEKCDQCSDIIPANMENNYQGLTL